MNDTVEGLLNDHFDGKKYDTEEENGPFNPNEPMADEDDEDDEEK